ncbi:hypothetical protein FHX34_10281 [Actinoplanes teichomyceticus]|uniref:Uncharacterized protein n=1 Tax=Actinoplanes teichomyceticus TaxID=1867 RepID=A0A561WI59_ACTTI|nr:hypothetical protein FHX34_10281 [Actinoplanes teichomyceticus]GIF16159.1 hypothetical protein Ate01nite_61910 [Actinoplanes teichomyceticus]
MRLAREATLQDSWGDYVRAGLLSMCELTELEIFYTARSAEHRDRLASDRSCPLSPSARASATPGPGSDAPGRFRAIRPETRPWAVTDQRT